jgi:2-phospho-L-lactate guanylyltransferase
LNVAVLVPIKAFADAKVRLAAALPAAERADLARTMAATVIAAAHDLPVSVVCDDDDVAVWAAARGASVILRPGRGLNGAVADGVAALAAGGASHVVVAHADLPLASDLRPVAAGFEGVTLVPDRHGDGTNVLCVPTTAAFEFQYGPRSFARHRAEAERLGLAHRVIEDARLAWDVDLPEDLRFPTCA